MRSSKIKRSNWLLPVMLLFVVVAASLGFLLSKKLYQTHMQSKPTNLQGYLAFADNIYALPEGGTKGGDVWLLDPETFEKYRLTTNSNIHRVYDWSPDGKYIAAEIREKRGSMISSIGIVDVESGTVTKLKDNLPVRNQLFWKSNDEIVYLRSDITHDTTLSSISITDKTETDIVVLPEELASNPKISSDNEWIIAGDSQFDTGKIYSYNLNTKQKKTITNERAQFGGLIGNKVIYATLNDGNNGIWEVDLDGKNRRKLIDLGNKKTSYLVTSENGTQIAYVATEIIDNTTNQQLISYNYVTGITSKTYVEENAPSGISGLEFSQNGNFLSFYSGGIRLINIKTGTVSSSVCNTIFCNSNWSSL